MTQVIAQPKQVTKTTAPLTVAQLENAFLSYSGIGGFITIEYLSNDKHLKKSKITGEKRTFSIRKKATYKSAILGKKTAQKKFLEQAEKKGIEVTRDIAIEERKGFEKVNDVLLRSKGGLSLEVYGLKADSEIYVDGAGNELSSEVVEEYTSNAKSKQKDYVNPKTQARNELDLEFDYGLPLLLNNIQSISFGNVATGAVE